MWKQYLFKRRRILVSIVAIKAGFVSLDATYELVKGGSFSDGKSLYVSR